MNAALALAGSLGIVGGLAHSVLGERYVIAPIFRRADIPATPFGDAAFTKAMVRGFWHFFTAIAWTGAGVLLALAPGGVSGGAETIVRVIAVSSAVFAAVMLLTSRGRHPAWLLGFTVAASAWWGTV